MENVENIKNVEFLGHALTRSHNFLKAEQEKDQDSNHIPKCIKHLANNEGGINRKGRNYKGNISGLNLCSIANEELSKKSKVNETNNSKITNGRPWKHAEIYSPSKLSRRPLHPEAHNNETKSSVDEKESSENGKQTPYFVCHHCGGLSKDRAFCDWCCKLLPKNPKLYFKESGEKSQERNTSESLIAKRTFYGNKFQEYKYPAEHPENAVSHTRQTVASRFCRKHEPECLTISSDESDNDNNSLNISIDKNNIDSLVSGGQQIDLNKHACKESVSVDETTERNDAGEKAAAFENDSTGDSNSENYVPPRKHTKLLTLQTDMSEVSLTCRSIRIGSHKIMPRDPFKLTTTGFSFISSTVRDENNMVNFHISKQDVIKILGCFSKTLQILFIFTTPGYAGHMRSLLHMNKKCGPYFDPGSSDETEKRITVIPETINDDELKIVKAILCNFVQEGKTENIFQEIDSKLANEILIRSTPEKRSSVSVIQRPSRANITNLMTYPPPPQRGGITITTDDYVCLEEGQFINDVIIDFYLKYLVQNRLSDEDQKRTHIFSSFFYRRLTQKPLRKHCMNEDPNLSPAENRHSRVKTWTRHVDIFEKDFIIIPINEHSHWFLAVVCYPYLDGPINFSADTQEIKERLSLLNASDCASSNTSTNTVFSDCGDDIKTDELVDMNDLENEELQINYSLEEEEAREAQENMQGCIKQPCILIFDSLLGASKARIVAILREYLKVEWQVKKKCHKTFDKEIMKGASPRVPQQKNYSDCGVYLLQYVESFFQNPIQDYAIPIRSLQEWFTDDEVSKKREQLKRLIWKLMLEQQGHSVLPCDIHTPSQNQEMETSESQESSTSVDSNTLWNIDSQS